MSLIEEIVEALSMDIRGNSRGLEYLEAVLDRKDLALLNSLLEKHIGLAAKESGKEQNLPREINELVDSLQARGRSGDLRCALALAVRSE
jgi:hypothetical protein